jgi:hypothetical protein
VAAILADKGNFAQARRLKVKSILLASAMLASMSVANAADITAGADSKGIQVIEVQGEIDGADHWGFPPPGLESKKRTFVYLTSRGGVLGPGLAIGKKIREYGFETVVRNYCLSVCGLMWLAGTTRWVFEDAIIGFHAAFDEKPGQPKPEVSPDGNAIVGAYLARLGLSDKAIRYLTSTPPQSMAAFDKKVADELGIVAKTVGAR